jgi:Mrp family chromosome partitioning ATPase
MPLHHRLLILAWQVRHTLGLPVLAGLLLGAAYGALATAPYHASITLQLAADQARAPLLQNITAPGNSQTLNDILLRPDLISDAATEAERPIRPSAIRLEILNNRLLTIHYASPNPANLASLVEALGYHFIQELLAPERLRLDELANTTATDLANVQVQLQRPGLPAAQREQLNAQNRQLSAALQQLVADQRLVNTAFVNNSAQALLWFAGPADVTPPQPWPLRLLLGAAMGLLAGLALALLTRGVRQLRPAKVNHAQHTTEATGLAVLGDLPWLGSVHTGPQGTSVRVGNKTLRPVAFAEVGRLVRALQQEVASDRKGPLVLTTPHGHTGLSLLLLLLAESLGKQGKRVLLIDLNLKNRGLSRMLAPSATAWAYSLLPPATNAKAKPNRLPALALGGLPGVALLPAPTLPATLSQLAQPNLLKNLLTRAQQEYDVVLIDPSPADATNRQNVDPLMVAATASSLGGGVILLARAGVTPLATLSEAAAQLRQAGANLRGVILNRVDSLSERQILARCGVRVKNA